MGVSHLKRDASAASSGKVSASSGSSDSRQISTPLNTRFKANNADTDYPKVSEVKSMTSKSLKGEGMPSQPNKMGGRLGHKGGQPDIGTHDKTAHPMSGGRMV
jgi:hypothetical protein